MKNSLELLMLCVRQCVALKLVELTEEETAALDRCAAGRPEVSDEGTLLGIVDRAYGDLGRPR